MENYIKALIGTGIIFAVALLSLAVYVLVPQQYNFEPIKKEQIYFGEQCTVDSCGEKQKTILNNQKEKDGIIATVFGTIYEDDDTAQIFGTCSDSNNHPTETNATVTVYFQNTSIFIDQQDMARIAEGRFNYSTGLVARGNHLVELNCTQGSDFAVAYTEFQNPDWTNKIQSVLDRVNDIGDGQEDFEIDKLSAASPIYPNETIYVESTFSDSNGTIIEPTHINLTILYPNRTQFESVKKGSLMLQEGIWNYSRVLTSSPVTGIYTVQMRANNSQKESIKTTQFRIATGGPFLLRLICPTASGLFNDLSCTVEIQDEGEVPVESLTTVWIDINGDGEIDPTEPQTSFSKETEPLEQITQSVQINTNGLPSGGGIFVVRAKTEYLGSSQPDSFASDTVNFLAVQEEEAGAGATGTSGTTPFKCNSLILATMSCYYFDANQSACVKGCPDGQACSENLQCVEKQEKRKIIKEPMQQLSFMESLITLFKGLFDTSPTLSAMQQEQQAKERVKETLQERKDIVKENVLESPIIALIVAGIIIMLLAFWQFGMGMFAMPFALSILSYWLIVALLWFFKVFRGGA